MKDMETAFYAHRLTNEHLLRVKDYIGCGMTWNILLDWKSSLYDYHHGHFAGLVVTADNRSLGVVMVSQRMVGVVSPVSVGENVLASFEVHIFGCGLKGLANFLSGQFTHKKVVPGEKCPEHLITFARKIVEGWGFRFIDRWRGYEEANI